MRSRLVWLLAGLGAAAIFAVLAGAAYIAWSAYDVLSEDDPFRPPFSSHHAVDLVARDLCPQATEFVRRDISAHWDTINFYVYVDASEQNGPLRSAEPFIFAVGAPEGHVRIEPADERSTAFREQMRARRALIVTPTPEP